jgi:hypothetical protein
MSSMDVSANEPPGDLLLPVGQFVQLEPQRELDRAGGHEQDGRALIDARVVGQRAGVDDQPAARHEPNPGRCWCITPATRGGGSGSASDAVDDCRQL